MDTSRATVFGDPKLYGHSKMLHMNQLEIDYSYLLLLKCILLISRISEDIFCSLQPSVHHCGILPDVPAKKKLLIILLIVLLIVLLIEFPRLDVNKEFSRLLCELNPRNIHQRFS